MCGNVFIVKLLWLTNKGSWKKSYRTNLSFFVIHLILIISNKWEDLKTSWKWHKYMYGRSRWYYPREIRIILLLQYNLWPAAHFLVDDQPPVIEILKWYPSLKIWKVLSYLLKHFNIVIILHVCIASLFQFRMEFKTLIGLHEKTSIHSLMESWPTWEKNDCLFFIENQA